MTFQASEEIKIISMSDVIKHPLYKTFDGKPNLLEAILYAMGLDIKKSYESDILKHRSDITNEVVTCERFVGTERQDEVWVKLNHKF